MVWRCAAPAAPSSTAKKPRSTVCCPQDEENASETKSHRLNQERKQGSSSQLKLARPNEKGGDFSPPKNVCWTRPTSVFRVAQNETGDGHSSPAIKFWTRLPSN
jgi:hypothetical protein